MELARTLFYHTMRPVVLLIFKIIYNFSLGTNPIKKVKGSYLIIGHHVNEFDAVYVNFASGRLVRFLAGDANMDTAWKRWLFNFLGMIPFRKKKSDMKSIRQLMNLAKGDYPIGLYPEGGQTWDGATDVLIPSTAKLIKMVNIPVYVTFYKGAFLTRPRWSRFDRRGSIQFHGFQLFTPEEVKKMTVDEIFVKMQEGLAYNEFQWQKEHMIKFKGKRRAEYIQRLLYKCPACGELNTIHSEKHDFGCSACGASYHMNVYGFIEGCDRFEDTHQWHQWQHSHIPEIVAGMDAYHLSGIRYEKRHSKTNERSFHTCDVTLTTDAIMLKCDTGSETIPITSAFGFSCTLRDIFEFYTTDYKYRLTFDPIRHLSIVFVLDLLNQLKENSKYEQ